MVEDGIGEVIGDMAEGAIEALGDFSYSANSGRRRRRGCWRLFLIVLVLAAAITLGVIVLGS